MLQQFSVITYQKDINIKKKINNILRISKDLIRKHDHLYQLQFVYF